MALAAALVLGTACGTRVDRTAAPAGNATATTSAAADFTQNGGGAGVDGTGGAAEGATGAFPSDSGSGSSSGPATPAASNGTTGATTKSRGGAATASGTASGGSTSGRAGGAMTSTTRPARQTGGAAAKPRPTATAPAPPSASVPPGSSPALVASVGTYSGPAAATLKPIVEGAQLWTKFINSKGGLNGHPVKLMVYDDGADPSRHRAQVQEAVEQKKVIAFLANAEALTGQGSNDYIASHKVPVIGVDGGWDFPYENPMYFLQHPSGTSLYLSFALSTAQQLVPTGKVKLATLNCQEAQGCTETDRIFRERAKALGFELVYQGRASIAQPDFTAECLAARNAGAQSFFVLMDGNSVSRVSAACGRQGYKPQYSLATSVILDRFKDDPNLEGAVGSSTVMPWFRTGTPTSDEFHGALKAFGGGLQPGVGMATGWTAGKLLERAGRNLTEPPTSESLLKELWTIRNDDLGGITYPLTFIEGKPPARQTCWFSVAIKKGKWISPDGYKQYCGK